VDTARAPRPPQSLLELAEPRWRGETAMANPLFGSTTTEAVALFQVLGPERARSYYRQRKSNGTRVVDGNGPAADEVQRGSVAVAQTDTDDAYIRLGKNPKLRVVFPDQKGIGALLIPNTAALIKGARHPEQAKRLLDYLVSPETELSMAALPSRQLPLHRDAQARLPARVRPLAKVKTMQVDYSRLPAGYPEVDRFLRDTFLR
jgi:iron(III) transport system substrate-binding protein